MVVLQPQKQVYVAYRLHCAVLCVRKCVSACVVRTVKAYRKLFAKHPFLRRLILPTASSFFFPAITSADEMPVQSELGLITARP